MEAWTGNKEIIQILLRANATATDKAADAFTPLHFVVQSQSNEAADCVRVLIKANKSLMNQRISKGNKSALHLAAIKGNEKVILTLIELGADVNATTSSGQTYLELIKSEELKNEIVRKIEEINNKKLEKTVEKAESSHVTEEAESSVGLKRPRDEANDVDDTD